MMRKVFALWILLLICGIETIDAQQRKLTAYAVGFYNQENLFDTCHDEGKRDYDFLPEGSYKWNGMKYSHKLRNMAQALADMGTDIMPKSIGCAIIGLSEVENAKALTDLINQEPLKARGYQFCHVEGPDKRGVDCALLYNPTLFTPTDVHLYPYVQTLEKDSNYYTRGFLTVKGTMAGEEIAVIVCHWPSRFNGSFYREQGGHQVRHLKDSLLAANPNLKIMVMGDMNDDPMDKSMSEALGAKREIKDMKEGDMYNPWWNELAKNRRGTLFYDGRWNLFDQIVFTPNMIDMTGKKEFKTLTFYKHQIFRRDYLIQQEGKYKGNPKRTHAGGVWLDGYSDHLPVVVYLVKESK